MVSRIALGAIWGYQRFISPRKGWRCAHSVLHGGTGCSGFAKHAIQSHGAWGAIAPIRQRLQDCRAASQTLRANCAVCAQTPEDDEDRRRKRWRNRRADACECIGTGCLGSLCNGAGAQTRDATPDASGGGGGVDCSMPDCGGGGCSPDCSCSPSCG